MNKKLFIALSFLILLVSLLDIKIIPFYKKLGLDFSNQYGLHHCVEGPETVYKKAAKDCLDFEGRPYVYPPVMYQMFSWTKLFSTVEGAYYFFVFLHIISFLGIVFIWAEKKILPIIYGFGLFVTYPNLFLLERGNSDMFIVFFWSFAFWLYRQEKYWLSGSFLALAVFAKLYPVYALIILAPFVLRDLKKHRDLILGFALGVALIVLIAPNLWFEYLVDVLPKWSSAKTPIYNLAHSLKSLPWPSLGSAIYLAGVAFWMIAASKSNVRRINWAWAGGLAICTFNNGVSFDYNLVTVFPLAIVGFSYFLNNKNTFLSSLFLLLTASIFGFREVFVSVPHYPLIRLILMGVILAILPYPLFDLGHEFKRRYQQTLGRALAKP